MTTKEATLKIPAIDCGSCIKSVTGVLEALPTVTVTHADPESKQLGIWFDESAVSLDQIRDALDEVGFSPED